MSDLILTPESTDAELQAYSDAILKAMEEVTTAVLKVGKMIVHALDTLGRDCVPILIEQTGNMLTVNLINKLERVGRMEVDHRLFMASGVGYRNLEFCNYSEQVHYLDNCIEVALGSGDTLLVKVGDLTPLQCRQVFDYSSDGGRVRDLGAQRAWLANEIHMNQEIPEKLADEAEVKGNFLIVTQPGKYPVARIKKLIEESGK